MLGILPEFATRSIHSLTCSKKKMFALRFTKSLTATTVCSSLCAVLGADWLGSRDI